LSLFLNSLILSTLIICLRFFHLSSLFSINKKSEITEGINFIRQIVDAEILYHAINDSYLHVYLPNAMQKLGYNIPSNAKFKYYQVQACGNNGFIASVST